MATRDQLKKEFDNGECPSREDYYAVFDSTINFDEDGIVKPGNQNLAQERNNPLKIIARGDERNVLNLRYSTLLNSPGWLLSFKSGRENVLKLHSSSNSGTYLLFDSPESSGCSMVEVVSQKGASDIGLLKFTAVDNKDNQARSWLLFQGGEQSGTYLALKSLVAGKSFFILNPAISNNVVAQFYAGGEGVDDEIVFVPTKGNVGIGLQDPKTKLDVNGIIRANEFEFSENFMWPITCLKYSGNQNDRFGHSVAIWGDWVVAGVPNSERVNLFKKDYDNDIMWSFEKAFSDANGSKGDQFGFSVSISDGYIAIGAPFKKNRKGSAYVVNISNFTLTELLIDNGNEIDQFGYCVSICNGYLIIGAPAKGSNLGAVYIFKKNSNANWHLLKEIKGENTIGFGNSVSITERWAIVGEFGANDRESSSYIIDVYQDPQKDWEVIKMNLPNNIGSRLSVAISGNNALVGSPISNKVYLFTNFNGWYLAYTLENSEAGAFGHSVAIYGRRIIIGAPNQDSINSLALGAVYFYIKSPDNSKCKLLKVQVNDDGDYGEKYGLSLSISEQWAVVGSPEKNNSSGLIEFIGVQKNIKLIMKEVMSMLK